MQFEIPESLKVVARTLLPQLRWAKDIRIWPKRDGFRFAIAAVTMLKAKIAFKPIAPIAQVARQLTPHFTYFTEEHRTHRFFDTVGNFTEAVELICAELDSTLTEKVDVTIMPFAGDPWVFGKDETYYYSLKKDKILKSKAPPYFTNEVWTDHGVMEKLPILDWAQLVKHMSCADYARYIAFDFDPYDKKKETYIASHCFSKLDGLDKAAKCCNGLIFPSIAAGLVPSTNFGPYVLIINPQVVTTGLKPYRTTKGEFPVVIYPSDAWTETTSVVFGMKGYKALLEWTGNSLENMHDDFSLLLNWGGGQDLDPLRNTKQFFSRLNRLRRLWNVPDLTAGATWKQIESKMIGGGLLHNMNAPEQDWYPYIEAKVNGVLSFNCVTAAFAPRDLAQDFEKALRKTDFAGQVIPVEIDSSYLSADLNKTWEKQKQAEWSYAWLIRQMILGMVKTSRDQAVLHLVR